MLFSVKTFIGAFMALGIALALDLPRPYWAMGTAYIVAQPFAGGVTSRGFYRVIGTIVGAAATVALVPNLVNEPAILCLALAIWIGICLYLSLLNRTPSSYSFVLAGYSAAIIGFPSVLAPGVILDTAISRVEEIVIGILCSTLVSRVLFPRHVGTVLASRTVRWLGDAGRWANDVLSGMTDASVTRADRNRLATDTVEMIALTTQLAYDTSPLRAATAQMRVLQQRMTALLPLLSGIDDRLIALRRNGPLDSDLTNCLAAIKGWIVEGEADGGALTGQLQRILAAGQAQSQITPDWPTLLTSNLVARLLELVEVWADCLALRRAITEGRRDIPVHLSAADGYAGMPALHLDRGIALLSAVSCSVGIFVCCAFWIVTGWHDGAGAATMVAVFCSLFASLDNPVPLMRRLAIAITTSTAISGIYLFAIIPSVETFPGLVLVFSPVLLPLGALIPSPKLGGVFLLLCVMMLMGVALQTHLNLDVTTFVNGHISILAGIIVAISVTSILRSIGVEESIERLMQANWRELARVSIAASGADVPRLARRFIDRFGLIVQRSAALPRTTEIKPEAILSELRAGVHVVGLQRVLPGLPQAEAEPMRRLLKEFGAYFNTQMPDDPAMRVQRLLPPIDAAIATFAVAPHGQFGRDRALSALIGLRCALFPTAPAVSLPTLPLR
jgi:uncharacterized membrane protein YccC